MREGHGLHIGHPDNLVNSEKLLNSLEQTMGLGVCIYCEKKFPSTLILRKHMRKKKHFSVHPQNKVYDQYYIVNYLDQSPQASEGRYRSEWEDDDANG